VLCAWVLHSIGLSFDVNCGFDRTLATVAYASTPIFLMWVPDAIPAIPTWICWAIGAAFAISLLYHGVAQMMRPEQNQGIRPLFGEHGPDCVLHRFFTFHCHSGVAWRLLNNLHL